jgi:hypothetical protein
VVLDKGLKVLGPEMPCEYFRWLHRKADVPGDIWRVLEPNRRKDNLARGHGRSYVCIQENETRRRKRTDLMLTEIPLNP